MYELGGKPEFVSVKGWGTPDLGKEESPSNVGLTDTLAGDIRGMYCWLVDEGRRCWCCEKRSMLSNPEDDKPELHGIEAGISGLPESLNST